MLKREISPVVLLEVIFALLLIVTIFGFAASGGAEPATFVAGVAVLVFALVACEGRSATEAIAVAGRI